MNKKPFQYRSHFGTVFNCPTCDLSKPIVITDAPAFDLLLRDVAEMAGWHAVNIRPELNGFAGYDCLTFVGVPKEIV